MVSEEVKWECAVSLSEYWCHYISFHFLQLIYEENDTSKSSVKCILTSFGWVDRIRGQQILVMSKYTFQIRSLIAFVSNWWIQMHRQRMLPCLAAMTSFIWSARIWNTYRKPRNGFAPNAQVLLHKNHVFSLHWKGADDAIMHKSFHS